MGKSHIIAFVTLLLMSTNPAARVIVLYTNEMLRKKDEQFINRVRNLLRLPKKLFTCCTKPTVTYTEKDIVLVDECDDMIFSNLSWFAKKLKRATVIGFTATTPGEEESHEGTILNNFFDEHIFDSKLSLKPIEGQ